MPRINKSPALFAIVFVESSAILTQDGLNWLSEQNYWTFGDTPFCLVALKDLMDVIPNASFINLDRLNACIGIHRNLSVPIADETLFVNLCG